MWCLDRDYSSSTSLTALSDNDEEFIVQTSLQKINTGRSKLHCMGIYEAQCVRFNFITISSVLLLNCCSNFCFTLQSQQTNNIKLRCFWPVILFGHWQVVFKYEFIIILLLNLQAIMSWNSYVDSLIAQSQGNIDKATIIGLNGAIWTPAGSVSIFLCCCCLFKSNSP